MMPTTIYSKSINTEFIAIGDYFYFEGSKEKIKQSIAVIDGLDTVWLSDVDRAVHVSELIPVFINEEETKWFDIMNSNNLFVNKNIDGYQVIYNRENTSIIVNVKYVHEIQSLLRVIKILNNHE